MLHARSLLLLLVIPFALQGLACGSEPVGPTPDAAVADAGPDPDVATPDARPGDGGSSLDAAVDAGLPADGGSPDGGSPDGGLPGLPACGLLTNGDAETGNLDGWSIAAGDFEVAPGGGQSPTPYSGAYAFFAGQAAASELAQIVDVSAHAAAIDTGTVYAQLEAYVHDGNGSDASLLRITAMDGLGVEVGTVLVGPFHLADWALKRASLLLPVGTRGVRVGLRGERSAGQDNDAYFDQVSLCLNTESPVSPPEAYAIPPYLTWVTQDAVSVMWESLQPVVGRVDYGPTPALGSSLEDDQARTVHELRLTGLQPGQVYYYRVSWPDGLSALRSFRTAPADGATGPFSFVVWGDNQDGVSVFEQVVPLMDAQDPDFALSVGDTVSTGTRDNYRNQLLIPVSAMADHVPLLITLGNHNTYTDTDTALFEEYLSLPADEHCFGWRWGNLYVVAIDTNLSVEPGSPVDLCIGDALGSAEAQTATFRAAFFHHPPRIEWWVGGAIAFTDDMEKPRVREVLEPRLEDLGVNIVFNGHNHLYAYTPETPGGITWVTTGGGGGTLESQGLFNIYRVGTWPEITVTLFAHHVLNVTVDGGTMSVEAVGLDGSVLHSFSITN
jgi:hypothetical protein